MIQGVIKLVRKNNPKADVALLQKAYEFAAKAHEGQLRASGEPFLRHPVAVAKILAELELDVITIAAGLLHDVVEDTGITLDQIAVEFSKEVAALVDGVTKLKGLNRIESSTKEEEQVENYRKMFLAMAKDIRVILIKLADRLHNMRTLKSMPIGKQKEISQETMDIFAPLAHRLGIYTIKWELEDLAFRYLEPRDYYALVERVAKKRRERESIIEKSIETIRNKLDEAEIRADIEGRPKHFYSIYKKMADQGKDFSEIYDLTAVRIIVETVRDCYGALGLIHSLWKPIPGRFKDFIAMPKPNMYQSLHTTVIGIQGELLEIQIRTWDMHRTAEYGIAAHWRYKEGAKGDKELEQKLAWLRHLLEWQTDTGDAKEFMETLRVDLFADEVFVFTPKGDVIDLPAGAVPIDFAYRIHTDVGNRCIGAKVNGKIVPLEYELKNGDFVEILTSKQAHGPSRDWIKLVKTSQAKTRIRQWFKKERREENTIKGKELLEREIKKCGYDTAELLKTDRLDTIAEKLGYSNSDDLYAAVGEGRHTALNITNRLQEDYGRSRTPTEMDDLAVIKYFKHEQQKTKKEQKKSKQDVKVAEQDNILFRFSKCCTPLPGDSIVGYITRGRGVSIHRHDCPNIAAVADKDQRLIPVKWEDVPMGLYQVEIDVVGVDRPGLLSDVINTIGDTRTNISTINAHTDRKGMAHIDLTLEIKNLAQLDFVLEKIRRTRDIIQVERVTRSTDTHGTKTESRSSVR